MTRKRSKTKAETPRPSGAAVGTKPPSDAPITGVATGSLGTAANLDDTQVMRTADLERAAAEAGVPAWLTDEPPPLAEEHEAWSARPWVVEPVPQTLEVPEQREVPPPERVQAAEGVKPRNRSTTPAPAAAGMRLNRRGSALAGAAVGAVLVLLAGAALLGTLGNSPTNQGFGLGPPFADSTFAPLATQTAEPQAQGKGNCHGKGNGCKGKD